MRANRVGPPNQPLEQAPPRCALRRRSTPRQVAKVVRPMARASRFDFPALVTLWGAIVYCWRDLLAPAATPLEYLFNPAYFAIVAATASAASYTAICLLAKNAQSWRKALLATFLGGMPLIYLWAAMVAGGKAAILLELGGAFLFVPLAVFGYRRSPLVLGAGIAAHGIAWDLWHHHQATYIEPWYPAGCLVVDIAFFVAVALQELGGPPVARGASSRGEGRVSDAA